MSSSPLHIRNLTIHPGENISLALPTPEIYTCAPLHIPIHIIHGKKKGPTLLVCAALKGDEMNGVAIIQRLLKLKLIKKLRGTLIAIPAVNIYGLMTQSRLLPDRRDLEGSFPGSEHGPYSSRLAHMLTNEIFSLATHCIDIHTGEPYSQKFPQVLTRINDKEALDLAMAFNAPIILHTNKKMGLLWQLEHEQGIPTIRYEAGEALRLDELSIKVGVRGIINVMRGLEMLPKVQKEAKAIKPLIVHSTQWVHAPGSGLCDIYKKMGKHVRKGDKLAMISDPFGTVQKHHITSPVEGTIIARNNIPILNEGEPLMQIAKSQEDVSSNLSQWQEDEEKRHDEL